MVNIKNSTYPDVTGLPMADNILEVVEYPDKAKVFLGLRQASKERQEELKNALKNEKLQQYLTSLQKQHSLDGTISVSVDKVMKSLLQTLGQHIYETDHRFEGEFFGVGSFYDGTKVSKPDEFDTHFILKNRRFHEDFVVVRLHPDEAPNLLCKKYSKQREYWEDLLQEVILPEDPTESDTDYAENFMCLGAMNLGIHFCRILVDIFEDLELPEGLQHGGFASPMFSGVNMHGPAVTVMFNWQGEFDVSLDISLALPLFPGMFVESFEKMEPLHEERFFRLVSKEFAEKNTFLMGQCAWGDGWQLSTSMIERHILVDLDKRYNMLEHICVLKILNDHFFKLQYTWGKSLHILIMQMKDKILNSKDQFQMFKKMESVNLYTDKEGIDFVAFIMALNQLSEEDKSFQPLKEKCRSFLVKKKIIVPWFYFYMGTPEMQGLLHEIVKPELSTRSCIFKYIILNLYFDNNTGKFPAKDAPGLSVPFLMQVLHEYVNVDKHRHPMLKHEIRRVDSNQSYYGDSQPEAGITSQIHKEHSINIYSILSSKIQE